MKKSENKTLVISFSPDLVGSIVFMAVSVFFLFSMEKEVYVGSDDGVNARTFPFIVLFLMLSISLFMFIKEIILIARKKERKKISIDLRSEARSLIIFIVLLLYASSIVYVGFFISSIIFSLALAYLMGARKLSYFIIVFSFTLAICIVFRYVLNVRL